MAAATVVIAAGVSVDVFTIIMGVGVDVDVGFGSVAAHSLLLRTSVTTSSSVSLKENHSAQPSMASTNSCTVSMEGMSQCSSCGSASDNNQ